ncbi:hypothetical protein ONS95_006563 [Cadophora gregata]|uniref:uncharacterized protein n=1 Tax=Cadophora gregata TaxID=51156 RepID=UPI0026DB33BB|nr:uncharacterized protein ONS95_006563 [Cadophora gregata]KAK0101388.1 hypothetical protein ONS95_006563 [Cadophora gregata]
MNRCTVSSGSSTAKLLATATRSHCIRTSCSPEPPTRWTLVRAFQTRDLSSTSKQASHFQTLEGNDGHIAGFATGSVEPIGKTAAVQNGAPGTGTSEALDSSSEINFHLTSISNTAQAETSISIPHESSKPAVKRRLLPLSPLMNPSFLEAREKHRAPKTLPSKNPTPFQQQLSKNPYALALATPVRRCAISGTKLPSFFLQGFRVMSDPTSGEPWYVPANLANKHLPIKEREALNEAEEAQDLQQLGDLDNGREKDVSDEMPDLRTSKGLESGIKSDDKSRSSKMGYQAYTLNGRVLLGDMVDTSAPSRANKGRAGQAKFIPGGWRQVRPAMQSYGKAGWRPDMDKFITTLMGRRIAEAFVHLSGMKRGYMVGCTDWNDALKKPQVAAIFWTGSVNGDRDVSTGPADFATLEVGSQEFGDVASQPGKKKRKVPVYNLLTLLGKDKMDEVRGLVPNSVFEREVVVLKNKNATVEVQSLLWKLQGYVAEYHDKQAIQPESHSREL